MKLNTKQAYKLFKVAFKYLGAWGGKKNERSGLNLNWIGFTGSISLWQCYYTVYSSEFVFPVMSKWSKEKNNFKSWWPLEGNACFCMRVKSEIFGTYLYSLLKKKTPKF